MKNNIIKAELYDWRKIKDLQPKGFKTSLRDEVLKSTLQKHGVSRSFSVWQDKKGDVWCIDGHQRKRVLEDLENDGADIPELLMCEFIRAENKKQASEILIEVFNQKHSEMDFFEFEKFVDEFDLDIDLGLDDLLMFQELEDEAELLEAEEDDFDVPEGGIETDIVLGDLFEIGEHRLLCGDSTDSDQVAKLMNGEKADIAFTSPPYNAGTTPTEIKMGKKSKYANDNDNKDENEYLQLLTDFTNNSLLFCEYSFVNIQSLSGNKTALIDFLYNMKSVYADTIIWQKQNAQPAMAENVLNSQFEYVHVFSNKANRAIGTKKFRGTLSNVLEISKQTQNKVKEHNATFPIDLAAHFASNFCEKSVIDLFLGSGTTMVAAHQLNRKCYGCELDPKYCQVIINRMKKIDPTLVIKKNGEIIEVDL